jgi:hypothetical protein
VIKEDETMRRAGIDVKSLALGFLLGVCALLGAAGERKPASPVQSYQIATASATWVINTATGEVWQLNGEQGTNKFVWLYAGRPGSKDQPAQGTGY